MNQSLLPQPPESTNNPYAIERPTVFHLMSSEHNTRPPGAKGGRRLDSTPPESNARSGPVSVLVVDDDPETARGIQRSLMAMGNRVEVQTSGPEAVEALHKRNFDVVLSDVTMPGMDGYELFHALRAINREIPVVLLTGDPSVKGAARALEIGAFRYVTKPVSIEELTRIVEKAARMYRLAVVEQQAKKLLSQPPEGGSDRAALGRSLDRCLDGLWMAFQPIVDGNTRRVFGFEALMRSREPALPHPGAVLDAAERLGRTSELGRIIRQRTAQVISTAQGDPAFFVNVHVRDLLDNTLLSEESALAPHANRIILEITERGSLEEVPDVRQRIGALRELGFRIAVDDLGAGYAGLNSFALLEPEFVKLDMSLVRDLHLSKTKSTVVKSMVNLAKDMGTIVVGEGIECREERDTLIHLGCDLLQGFYLAKPGEPFPAISWN
jgi:EAL domain-containing protein (putative c-di-GMP-specific phosphodiesterase class I)